LLAALDVHVGDCHVCPCCRELSDGCFAHAICAW
jgi:hypothetical protein